jgi:adenylate cyclase
MRRRVIAICYKYRTITNGTLLADSAALRDTAAALRMAERSADDFTVALARLTRGLVLIHRDGPERWLGFELLARAKETALRERFTWTALPIIDTLIAKEKSRVGDLDEAIEVLPAVVNDQFDTGEMIWRGPTATVLVESLLRRGADGDRDEAQAVTNRLAGVPTDPGFVLHDIPLLRLRALLAREYGDEHAYRDYVQSPSSFARAAQSTKCTYNHAQMLRRCQSRTPPYRGRNRRPARSGREDHLPRPEGGRLQPTRFR